MLIALFFGSFTVSSSEGVMKSDEYVYLHERVKLCCVTYAIIFQFPFRLLFLLLLLLLILLLLLLLQPHYLIFPFFFSANHVSPSPYPSFLVLRFSGFTLEIAIVKLEKANHADTCVAGLFLCFRPGLLRLGF